MEEREARFLAFLADGIPARAKGYASGEAREFRATAISLLERAIFTASPFAGTADLITVSTVDHETETEPGDEPKNKGGKKRKRGDASLAVSLLTIWQSVFRDALVRQLNAGEIKNSDQFALVHRVASRFTTAQIQGIIEMIAKAQQNIAGGASVYLTLDGVLASLFIKENRELS